MLLSGCNYIARYCLEILVRPNYEDIMVFNISRMSNFSILVFANYNENTLTHSIELWKLIKISFATVV